MRLRVEIDGKRGSGKTTYLKTIKQNLELDGWNVALDERKFKGTLEVLTATKDE